MINLDHEIIKMFRQLQHFLKGSKSYILVALLWGHAIEALIVGHAIKRLLLSTNIIK